MSRTQGRKIAALILLSTAITSLSFVPGLRDYAAVFWLMGLAVMIGALVAAMRSQDPTTGSGPSKKWLSMVVIVAVAATLGFAVTRATSRDGDESRSAGFKAPKLAAGSTMTLAVSSETANLSDVALEPKVQHTLDLSKNLNLIPGKAGADLVRSARSLGYSTLSGLDLDYSRATAQTYGDSEVVSVPLKGTNLPEMSKVTFLRTGGETTILEMSPNMLDDEHVRFEMWQDGQQTRNVTIANPNPSAPAASAGSSIHNVGVDWRRLNTCLNSIGISWAILAVISVACAAACATAVLCAPCIGAAAGWTGGSIGTCVNRAWV